MATPVHRPRYETRGLTALHMIHKWSIEHPYVVLAFYFAMLVCAVIAIRFYLPRRFMPYVESPMVGIVTMMPGLSAEEMELYVSKPIDEAMVNIKNVRFIRSTSQDGFSIVSLECWYGTDMKRVTYEVQALMNVVQANLPATGANLKPSWVLPIDPLNLPVLIVSLRGDKDKGWDMLKLREFADNEVVNRLKTVTDVQSVVPFGGYRRQLQVIVDREKLAAYGLSILDVRNAIDRHNVSRPGGTLTSGAEEAIVRLDTRAVDAETVRNYPITAVRSADVGSGLSGLRATGATSGMGGMGGGSSIAGASSVNPLNPLPTSADSPRLIYVKDVARVLDTHWERRSAYHYVKHLPGTKGTIIPSIAIAVLQNPAASSWRTIQGVEKVLRQIERENPGIHFEEAYNNAHFVDILFEN
ncbi:MAG: efflux RND transporter permease subunit, partial [Abditibacteriales bacterium]|nr:efflux RND transporter permease subunit [Abditibacteriales bacterium]MDW8365539.1 efflux RND transporter permease subunit [Abditibacteriales bacterium]